MKLTIEVTEEELMQAAENLVYTQSLDKDTEADYEAIAVIIKEHLKKALEKAIENILSDPENYLKSDEWSEVNKCFIMSYSAYQKMMDRDIPYPL